jgi:hypothetical protein
MKAIGITKNIIRFENGDDLIGISNDGLYYIQFSNGFITAYTAAEIQEIYNYPI